ncbi:WD40-repeat-containing domain protein [Scheffersomyces coipomensis]|uniref:WD40-repeat-containing domain protein n=1 Tax=Scheffersomyces coipomensis TaxID=1788519 RepID=UPI00315CA217
MAGDPFLSDPNRKRKRSSKITSTSRKPTNKKSRSSTPSTNKNNNNNYDNDNDEEISGGSETEDEQGNVSVDSGDDIGGRDEEEVSSDEEFADENEADRRRRLAKQYLQNLNEELNDGDDNDFDAKDLDDDIVGRRLQVDVAENKGYVYKFIGDKISTQIDGDIPLTTTRIGSKHLTALSVRYPYLYTVSKDCELIKWDISKKKPQRIKHSKGGEKYFKINPITNANHHWDQITCVATSFDGKYVVTGGTDSRLIIWSTETLSCLKVLETRSAVNSITFRRNSDQLYAACADLRIRTYSVNQFTQLEILYGHQDNITDISALARETCVSVGSRDKTAMFWKIAEESRLTFRGGDSTEKRKKKKKKDDDIIDEDAKEELPFHYEGSMEVVSMLDESHFVTGSDNGNVALWSLAKKKALFTERLSHGLQPQFSASKASAETSIEKASQQIPERQPYWLTAIHAIPFSDVFLTGSYDGNVKIWKIDDTNLRSFSLIGTITNIKGCVVKIDSAEITDKKKVAVFVLTSKEHKQGRWFNKIEGARNALHSFTFDI